MEITDLDFNVNISGVEDNSAITFGYSAPFGEFSVLALYPCPGTNGLNLTYDDEGNPVDCSNLNTGGHVFPEDLLSVADGENAFGDPRGRGGVCYKRRTHRIGLWFLDSGAVEFAGHAGQRADTPGRPWNDEFGQHLPDGEAA